MELADISADADAAGTGSVLGEAPAASTKAMPRDSAASGGGDEGGSESFDCLRKCEEYKRAGQGVPTADADEFMCTFLVRQSGICVFCGKQTVFVSSQKKIQIQSYQLSCQLPSQKTVNPGL